ncbi:MAG: alpha/beta hydrolase [Chitinophagales bacterium]|nr:alpha/beta hydrolase [Chitinophagales bacterium]MCZ2394842.1 alpha/beta hydrolase [Chitinophagales bacterium]
MLQKYFLTIDGSEGELIPVKYFIPPHLISTNPVIIAHGFKGFMDWGHFPMLGEQIAQKGYAVVMFNFSHNGTSPECPTEFSRLDLFSKNTYSKELYDLDKILDEVQNSTLLKSHGINGHQVSLIGHSRGGGIAILKASQDKRISKLITWAATDSFGSFFASSEEMIQQWKSDGEIYTYNSRTQQNMPIKYSLYEDVLLNRDRLDVSKAATLIRIPWLIIHGKNDSTVSVDVARKFHEINPLSSLYIMEAADHNFGGKHPLDNLVNYHHLNLLLLHTVDFLKDNNSSV